MSTVYAAGVYGYLPIQDQIQYWTDKFVASQNDPEMLARCRAKINTLEGDARRVLGLPYYCPVRFVEGQVQCVIGGKWVPGQVGATVLASIVK